MRIFNLQGRGAPEKPKKKIKYAEIDFTSHQWIENWRESRLISDQVVSREEFL
jgi:hypothetical protein